MTQTFVSDDIANNDQFGTSAVMRKDGLIAVTSPLADNDGILNTGAVYIFDHTSITDGMYLFHFIYWYINIYVYCFLHIIKYSCFYKYK